MIGSYPLYFLQLYWYTIVLKGLYKLLTGTEVKKVEDKTD